MINHLKSSLGLVLVVSLLMCSIIYGLFSSFNNEIITFNSDKPIQSVSYTPLEDEGQKVLNMAKIDRELAEISKFASNIRLYETTNQTEEIVLLAKKYNLTVSLGVWVSNDISKVKRQIKQVLALGKRYHDTISSIYVGNEVLLRKEIKPAVLINYIKYVNDRTSIPVSTGEIRNNYIAHPDLVNAVDFLAIHVLSYWENATAEQAVDHALAKYDSLRKIYNKKVAFGEFGWPSAGYNKKGAYPGREEQIRVLREFIYKAKKRGISYNIVEAIDAPWKTKIEGSVGPYWGILDSNAQPKFEFAGQETKVPDLFTAFMVTCGLGFLFSLLMPLYRKNTLTSIVIVSVFSYLLGFIFAQSLLFILNHYVTPGLLISYIFGLVLSIPLIILILLKINELAELLFGPKLQKAYETSILTREPFVSVHIAAYRERPSMVIETINSVLEQDYSNFEIIVVLNNSPEEYTLPIITMYEDNPKVKVLNLQNISGFKAGALKEASPVMNPKTEIIGVLDADYVVSPKWLKECVGAFKNERVALMQSPQASRDGNRSVAHWMMDSEYAGFFDTGMIIRNEDNAIIIHGTMLLIRRSVFDEVGGWHTDTICEDTDLGLRIFEKGYESVYTDTRYGRGLLPSDYLGFTTQRHRWVFGAVQIFRKHLGFFTLSNNRLTIGQKYRFITGWFPWLSDAIGVVLIMLNLIWTPIMLITNTAIPSISFLAPIVIATVLNFIINLVLYKVKVKATIFSSIGASIAGLSLQFVVASAVFGALRNKPLAFKRTVKGSDEIKIKWLSFETVYLFLATVAVGVILISNRNNIDELNMFAGVLIIQAIPAFCNLLMKVLNYLNLRKSSMFKLIESQVA